MKSLLLITTLLMGLTSFAHPGKKNAKGCHMNSKTKKHHCHELKAKKKKAKATKAAKVTKSKKVTKTTTKKKVTRAKSKAKPVKKAVKKKKAVKAKKQIKKVKKPVEEDVDDNDDDMSDE